MYLVKSLTACLVLALLSACAAPAKEVASKDAPKEECRREYRVGSNIPTVNCSAPQTEEERQRTIEEMRNTLRNAPNTKAMGGG